MIATIAKIPNEDVEVTYGDQHITIWLHRRINGDVVESFCVVLDHGQAINFRKLLTGRVVYEKENP